MTAELIAFFGGRCSVCGGVKFKEGEAATVVWRPDLKPGYHP